MLRLRHIASQWLIGVVWVVIYLSAIVFVHIAQRKGFWDGEALVGTVAEPVPCFYTRSGHGGAGVAGCLLVPV